MRKINILLAIFILMFALFTINAEEESIIDFSIELESLFGNTAAYSGISGLTLEETLNGSFSINPVDFYTLTFWSEDEFELGWDGDFTTGAPDYIGNDLEIAIDNTFSIENALDITIGYDQEFTWAPNSPLFLGFAPHFAMAGEYDFGLSWYIDNYFIIGYAGGYAGFNLDSEMAIEFEFFHFFAPEGISGSVYADNDTFGISTADESIYNDIEVGLNFDFYGVAPYIHFAVAPVASYSTGAVTAPLGLATGLSYSKNVLGFGVDYTGTIDVATPGSEFEHLIEAWITVGI